MSEQVVTSSNSTEGETSSNETPSSVVYCDDIVDKDNESDSESEDDVNQSHCKKIQRRKKDFTTLTDEQIHALVRKNESYGAHRMVC